MWWCNLAPSSNATGSRNASNDIFVGILKDQAPGNPDAFQGGIDEFQIWDTSLSESQIQTWLYEQKKYAPAEDKNGISSTYTAFSNGHLACHLSFDGPSDSTQAVDIS